MELVRARATMARGICKNRNIIPAHSRSEQHTQQQMQRLAGTTEPSGSAMAEQLETRQTATPQQINTDTTVQHNQQRPAIRTSLDNTATPATDTRQSNIVTQHSSATMGEGIQEGATSGLHATTPPTATQQRGFTSDQAKQDYAEDLQREEGAKSELKEKEGSRASEDTLPADNTTQSRLA